MNIYFVSNIKRIITWLFILSLACVSVFMGPSVTLCCVFLFFLICISKLEYYGFIIAFLVSESMVHLFKRFIFLFGEQSQTIYYGILLIPTILFLLTIILATQRLSWSRIPKSGKILSLYLALALLTTIISPSGGSLFIRLAAIQQRLFPFLMFYIGITVTTEEFPKIGRIMLVLAILSVVYGLAQFAMGPIIFDRIWAIHTHSYSAQANKVFNYIKGIRSEFRVFSYYADPMTWGLFLVSSFVSGIIAKQKIAISIIPWWIITSIILTGLFIAQTRTPFIGLLGTLFVYILIRFRVFRVPWFIFGLSISFFAITIWFGNYIFDRFFGSFHFENPILSRYSTIGTLSSRIWAFDIFKEIIPKNWIIGNGYSFSNYYMKYLSDFKGPIQIAQSHNFFVELVLYTGLPGLMLFLCFYYQWLKESFTILNFINGTCLFSVIRWVISFSFGFTLTGYLNGTTFMDYHFFLLLGIASSYYTNLGKEKSSFNIFT